MYALGKTCNRCRACKPYVETNKFNKCLFQYLVPKFYGADFYVQVFKTRAYVFISPGHICSRVTFSCIGFFAKKGTLRVCDFGKCYEEFFKEAFQIYVFSEAL